MILKKGGGKNLRFARQLVIKVTFSLISFQQMWVFDEEVGLNCREVTFVPGLYKIFDEILGEFTSHICYFGHLKVVGNKTMCSISLQPIVVDL